MNQHLQTILNFIQQSQHLSDEEKAALQKAAKDANKEIEITIFKLDRTEKVKRTTAILLEETIEELEQKRKAVEAQNKELEVEAALERVRTIAMSMNKADDMLSVCKIISQQLELLNVKEIRNVQTAIFYQEKGTYMNYEYYAKHDKTFITETSYTNSEMHLAFAEQMLKGNGEVFTSHINGDAVKDWIAYQKTTNVFIDDFLYDATSLNYYWFSLGPVALGISTYQPLKEEDFILFKRFLKVFELAYRRYLDIEKAEANAREAQIEAALERVRSRSLAMHKSDELQDVVNTVFDRLKALEIDMNVASIFIFTEDSKDWEQWVASSDTNYSTYFHLPYTDNVIFRDLEEAKQSGKDFYSVQYSNEEKNKWFSYAFANTEYSRIPDNRKQFLLESEFYQVSFALSKHIGLQLAKYSGEDFSENNNEILIRFAKVFEQAYVRFLDLQKAEAQSIENQIQLALERARTQSMIMQHSTELDDTLRVFHEQILQLNIPSAFSFLWLPDEEKDRHIFWAAWAENNSTVFKSKAINYLLDRNEPATAQCLIDWKGNEPVVSYHVPPDGVANYFAAWSELIADVEQLKPEYFSDGLYYVEAFMKYGCFGVMVKSELNKDEQKILERFAIEFERAYTRFLDLQKAEVQARESQIELGLERVRARAMAMQTSEELNPLIGTVFTELTKLDLLLTRCVILIYERNEKGVRWWMANSETPSTPMNFFVKYADMPFFNEYFKGWQNRSLKWQYCLEGENKLKTDDFLFTETELSLLPDFVIAGMRAPDRVYLNASFNNFGNLTLASLGPLSEEHFNILLRFAKVFDLTYTRFNDLQKAEAQARESQIQLALERVRARTMAMQKSEELTDAANLLFQQIQTLGMPAWSAGYCILDEDKKNATIWMSSEGVLQPPFRAPLTEEASFIRMREAYERGEKFYVEEVGGELLMMRYQYMRTLPVAREILNSIIEAGYPLPTFQIFHFAYFSQGFLLFITYEPVPEAHDIFKRFGNVFDQTYTRFLDLQKAEAQAREAQIETALERVRAIAMSMMKSDELMNICEVVFKQLQMLGFTDVRAAQIYIRNDAEEKFLNYDYSDNNGADVVEVSYNSHPNTRRIYDVIKNAGDGLIDNAINKQQLDEWRSYLYNILKQPREKELDAATELHYYLYSFGMGAFGISTFTSINDNELEILKRFRNVFSLSYQRYTDIALAEAQAREAKIEAALERVRSRTLAMQKSDELAETSAVLFKQLIGLGIKPNRLYISIMKDDAGNTEFWITDEDGSKVSMAYEDNLNNNPSFQKMYKGWKEEKTSLVIDMKGKELKEYLHHLSSIHVPFKGGLTQKRRWQYIAYFSKGFIGMAAPDEQPAETLQLLERFAYVFNLTFTRFNDLQIAEAHAVQAEHDLIEIKAARKRAEETLVELQSTQKQLVQSEKMASLGELTAGIAHEIQNPLNFVNNFSEVSDELLDEVKEELATGNLQQATETINDIKQNLKKINHHGKRADAIVKGMLQHSRASTGKTEPTDINALCDEFLRLSYHGLRAKDKSFNSDFKTEFDETIGKINIVPQDIGRVLLNLYNNAFYAVSKKQKTESTKQNSNYKPLVIVSTKLENPLKRGRGACIIVSDNGNGISQNIIDKIFQPFFTTKPTGQGTGLGLSLAYDIIKAHGGEIKVNSKEGEGSEFIIQINLDEYNF